MTSHVKLTHNQQDVAIVETECTTMEINAQLRVSSAKRGKWKACHSKQKKNVHTLSENRSESSTESDNH